MRAKTDKKYSDLPKKSVDFVPLLWWLFVLPKQNVYNHIFASDTDIDAVTYPKMSVMSYYVNTYFYEKHSGLATLVNPAAPVITTPFAPPLQWTIRRLPSASLPPTIPTCTSAG